MNTESALTIFDKHRTRLFGIAYRMLGARSDAEDILQEAYLRWSSVQPATIDNPEAWLVTATTRLCIDRLRIAKTERAAYIGPWVPEPIVAVDPQSPESVASLAGEISLAFLLVLERLAPEERAAFLLREIFDFEYAEIADMLGKTATTCRQIVHRAKERVRQDRPRFNVKPEAHKQLLERFVAAASSGDTAQMMDLLAVDAKLFADGGGKVIAALRVLEGSERLARLYQRINHNAGGAARFEFCDVNGELGLLCYLDNKLDTVFSFVTDGERILEIYSVRNPDKLKNIFH